MPLAEASAATPDDEPWFLRRYTRGDPFAHDGDDQLWSRRGRDRDWNESDRSSGSGGSGDFGGGSSSGGGASGKW